MVAARVSSFVQVVFQVRKNRVELAAAVKQLCMKDWNYLINCLARWLDRHRIIARIKIKKHEDNKWKVAVTKLPKHGVGLHDLFW
jgi:hypothetical protein